MCCGWLAEPQCCSVTYHQTVGKPALDDPAAAPFGINRDAQAKKHLVWSHSGMYPDMQEEVQVRERCGECHVTTTHPPTHHTTTTTTTTTAEAVRKARNSKAEEVPTFAFRLRRDLPGLPQHRVSALLSLQRAMGHVQYAADNIQARPSQANHTTRATRTGIAFNNISVIITYWCGNN